MATLADLLRMRKQGDPVIYDPADANSLAALTQFGNTDGRMNPMLTSKADFAARNSPEVGRMIEEGQNFIKNDQTGEVTIIPKSKVIERPLPPPIRRPLTEYDMKVQKHNADMQKFDMEMKEKQGLKFDATIGAFIEPPSQNFPEGRIIRPQGMQDIKPKVNMSPTVQKEIFESDEFAQSGKNTVGMLQEALNLNKQAYSGALAKERAVARSQFGEDPRATATINLDNIMTSQALESLKSVFGGMPTEGERKILMDIQASADKTPAQRELIIKRAIQAAERRAAFNSKKAESLRSGSYFTEGMPQVQEDDINDLLNKYNQ